jgi:ribosomal protein RSM22 (predicted rRNA methylase)
MSTLPIHLLEILKKHFPTGRNGRQWQEIATDVADLSQWFTREKSRNPMKPDYMAQQRFRDAYILYYLPPNFLKAVYLFEKTARSPVGLWAGQKEFSLLDVGCGPGTAGIAAAFFFHENKREKNFKLRIVSVDRSPEVLKENLRLMKEVSNALKKESPGFEVDHQALRLDIEEGFREIALNGEKEFDAVFFSNVLAEMGSAEKERDFKIIRFTQEALSPMGLAFFLEPAQRIHARTLLSLRDSIAEEGTLSILSPCPEILKCPALNRSEKDWCHDDIHWERPEYMAEIDQLAGLRKESLKFTHLIASKAAKENKKAGTEQPFVVVSALIGEKGKVSAFLCGKDGRYRFELLRKDRSESNEAFLNLKRGEKILLRGFIGKGEIKRLNKKSVVLTSHQDFF